jgi:hypothetical protein
MRNILVVSLVLLLSGCFATAKDPIKAPFPTPAAKLMEPPRRLFTLDPYTDTTTRVNDTNPSNVTLSQIADIISKNYTTCNLNNAELEALQTWVRQQAALNPPIPAK